MIRTIIWFGGAGFFASSYSNLVRGLPMMRKPMMHTFFTSIGLYAGYLIHKWEDKGEAVYEEMVEKHKNVPWWPKAQLLAEKAAREQVLKEGM